MMRRSRRFVGLIAGLLLVTLPAAAMGQDAPPRSVTFDEDLLLGTTWQLSEIANEDGAQLDIPDGVSATLHAYLGALPSVVAWSIADGRLHVRRRDGEPDPRVRGWDVSDPCK